MVNNERKSTNGHWTDSKEIRKKLPVQGFQVAVLRYLRSKRRARSQAAPRDAIWGIGYGASNAEARRSYWGLNLLGKALMRVRTREDKRRDRLMNEGICCSTVDKGWLSPPCRLCYVML